jgi:type II secretory pathway component GspD/PulD (secretin)
VDCVSLLLVVALEAGTQAQPPRQLPPLPLTQLDERAPAADLDNRTFSLTFAQPVPVRDLLLLLVRGTSLSVVPDPGIGGTFIGELKNVTIRRALTLILQPLGFDYSVDGTVIRVVRREAQTRIFDVNYIATVRRGESTVGGGAGRTRVEVSATSRTDLFEELAGAVKPMLSEQATFSLDRKAGLLQVTDFPERLDRVALYLDALNDRVHRQIQIDAQVIEVELNEEYPAGIDWRAIGAQLTGTASPAARSRRALTGLRATDLARLLELLESQGTVATLATPSLLAVNNEPAIVRSDALTISVTPQAGGDGAIMLAVTPIVSARPASAKAAADALAIESDMLARVADGETLVLAGFMRDREVRERRNLGTRGGWFGRGTVVTKKKVELVLLLTPRVIVGVNAQ